MAFVSVFDTFSKRSKDCSAAKCSELEFACGCTGLESRSDHALSAGFVFVRHDIDSATLCNQPTGGKMRISRVQFPQDLSLVDTNSTPAYFVNRQLTVYYLLGFQRCCDYLIYYFLYTTLYAATKKNFFVEVLSMVEF